MSDRIQDVPEPKFIEINGVLIALDTVAKVFPKDKMMFSVQLKDGNQLSVQNEAEAKRILDYFRSVAV